MQHLHFVYYGMKIKQSHVYIITNKYRTVFYVGVTSNIKARLNQHVFNVNKQSFSFRYNCKTLVYLEEFNDIVTAIAREKQLKGWRRAKKLALIRSVNPELKSWNGRVLGQAAAP